MKIKKWSPLLFPFLLFLPVLLPAQAQAITLGELELTNGTIELGDKRFSDFETNVPGVQVEGRIFPLGNTGLRFMSMPNFGPDSSFTANIGFTVTVLDPNFRISELFQAAFVLPEGTGTIRVTDTAFALGTNTVLGSGSIFTTGLPISGTLPILNSYALSHQVKALRFERRVDFTGPLSGDLSLAMSATQTPIPEPSTVLLLGSGVAGLVLWRWKKNRVG